MTNVSASNLRIYQPSYAINSRPRKNKNISSNDKQKEQDHNDPNNPTKCDKPLHLFLLFQFFGFTTGKPSLRIGVDSSNASHRLANTFSSNPFVLIFQTEFTVELLITSERMTV
jgi:hypothetical protein